jgi:hypothetical protein
MAVLFPFANVGRISPIITHCADYVELFMRTYIAKHGRRLSIYSPSNLRVRRRRCPWRNRVMYWISHISLRQHAILYRQVVTRANRSQTPKQDSPRESEGGGSGKCRDRSYRSKASVIGEGTGCMQPKNFPGAQRATCRFARPPVGADQVFTQPTGTFTSGLSTDWSPAPPPDITTVVARQVPLTRFSPAGNAN